MTEVCISLKRIIFSEMVPKYLFVLNKWRKVIALKFNRTNLGLLKSIE